MWKNSIITKEAGGLWEMKLTASSINCNLSLNRSQKDPRFGKWHGENNEFDFGHGIFEIWGRQAQK